VGAYLPPTGRCVTDMATSDNNTPESPPPISSPWVLLDDLTLDQAATVL
jgi:hypothetical protein